MIKKAPIILGHGFVGSHLSNYFIKSDFEHSILNRRALDYSNKDSLNKYLKENKDQISYIINCFGYTGTPNVDGCETNREECWNYNVLYPLRVLEVADSNKIPVVHVGSGCVYTGYDKDFTEEDVPNFGLYSQESSFYSRCKHEFEILADGYCVYILRIRIPFTGSFVSKNYFTKLVKYNNLIDNSNSVTCMSDFCEFMFKMNFLLHELPGGIYNVVNPQPVKTEQTIELLRKYGINNKNWNFIKDYELNTIARRSNCVLSTKKIENYNLQLPNTLESLEKEIKKFSLEYEMVSKE
jgi:dTDP-4-dehydrorhamnose reductase